VLAAGIPFALAAAAADALGVALMASEARLAPRGGEMRVRLLLRLLRRRRWLAGTALTVGQWPLQVTALAFAPITVVQPMLATSQLGLLWLARTKLGEHVGWRERGGALALVGGLVLVVLQAPSHSSAHAPMLRLTITTAIVGGVAVWAFALGRVHPRVGILLVVAAGLSYAWTDFASKLLAQSAAGGRWALAGIWLAAALGVGALAFLEENTAMGERPAISVGPVISALKVPIPVLMAFSAGVEELGSNASRIGTLLTGLGLVAGGAAVLARVPARVQLNAAARGR
jgi:drug/metabolite transporter (DMT)-like permease